MCLKQKTPPTPVVQPPPSRDTVASATVDARRRAGTQKGVYGNITTSPLGDSTYGTNTAGRPALATFGG